MSISDSTKSILMMIIASISVASGQFFWKLSQAEFNIWLILGFSIYGVGALLMIGALKIGKLSVLHPIMAFSYIFAFFLSVFFLNESWDSSQIIGIIIITIGVILLGIVKEE